MAKKTHNDRAAANGSAEAGPAASPPRTGGETDGTRSVRAPVSRVRGPKLAEQVATTIAAEIFERHTPVDTRLPSERDMMEDFGVSRGTLREALRILEVHGLVTMRVGFDGGPVVSELSPVDFGRVSVLHFNASGTTYREVWEARIGIEPLLAGQAAQRQGRGAADLLEGSMLALANVPASDPEAYVAAGSDFHREVCGLSGNRVLSLFAGALARVSVARFPPVAGQSSQARQRTRREHRTIASAIENGDVAGATAAMRAHLEKTLRKCEDEHRAILDEVVSVRHEVD